MKFFLKISFILFLLILPFVSQAGEKSSSVEEDNVIIYRNKFSDEEQRLNRLRSLTREEHSWEMLKNMRIKMEFNNLKDSINNRTSE